MSKRMYDVTYVVTRTETYRVPADDETTARQTAFEEGQFLDVGETTSVDHLETKVISIS